MKQYQRVSKISLQFFSAATVVLSSYVVASTVAYHVKKNETLSSILLNHNLKPLYGKNGFIEQAKKLNIGKIKRHGNFIRAGETINLPIVAEIENQTIAQEPTPDIKKEIAKESRAPSDEYPYSHFIYSPHISFLKIDSSNDVNFGGSSVTALSKRGFGIDLTWHVFYDDRFSFFGYGSLNYFSFYSDPIYSFNNLSTSHLHVGAGGNFNYSAELKFTSKLSLRQISFLDVLTPSTINLESMTVPEIEMGFEKRLFVKKGLSANWGAHLEGLLPSSRGSYKSKLGYGAGTGIDLIHKNKALFLTYDIRSIQINEIDNKESTIMLGINFFGENVL
jgi:hypothetical protein